MSKAVLAVVGIVAIAASFVFAPYLTPAVAGFFFSTGAALVLNAAMATFFGPGSPKAPPLAGLGISYSGTLEPRRILYGTMKLAGMHAIPPMTSGSNNDYFHDVLVFTGHSVDSIGDIFLGQIRFPSANIAAVTGSTGDGLVSGIPTPPAGQVNGQPFNNLCWLRRYNGTQMVVDYILDQSFTAWDQYHIGREIAYIAAQYKYDQNVFSSGIPELTAIIKGKKLYDPRLDSTNGGSGTQRYTDPATWTWSVNPALCLRDYLTGDLGLGEDDTRIDDVLVAAAANKCDETVTVPIDVLVGLTNWTNNLVQVYGLNTAFTAVLANGYYVKAPNGTMLQIASVISDGQFNLTSAYTGATVTDQVTQWHATNVTTYAAKRYTCNVVLDATARYEDNISTLAGAMAGHCLYSGGKWRMFAGGWAGSAFSLDEDDLVGNVSVQASTPRKDLYNSVRGNFLDPQHNYMPAEFPAIINGAYVTEDGGETIYVETAFPCCTNSYEAQRNAIIMTRQSRNRRVVTAQYGMSAFGVKIWETGTVTLAEVGWVAQTVRCTGWKFSPQGVIELTLQEAYAADWTDPLSTDYNVKGVSIGALPQHYLPYPPSGLTAASLPGGIEFTVTLPDQVIPGTTIELLEHTAATPYSSALVIGKANSNKFVIARDTTTRYYWARTAGPNNQHSIPYPATNGLAAAGIAPTNEWLTAGLAKIGGDVAWKFGGISAWDSAVYTSQGHTDCHVTGKPGLVGEWDMLGLSDNPTVSTDYSNGDFSWYNNNGTWWVYEGIPGYNLDDAGKAFGPVSLNDFVGIIYSGTAIYYYLNGVLRRTKSTTAGRTMYGFCPLNSPYGGWSQLHFGPTGNFDITDTTQLADDAATSVLTYSFSSVLVGYSGFDTQIHSFTVGPYAFDTLLVADATIDFSITTTINNVYESPGYSIRDITLATPRPNLAWGYHDFSVIPTPMNMRVTATIEGSLVLAANDTKIIALILDEGSTNSSRTMIVGGNYKIEVIKR